MKQSSSIKSKTKLDGAAAVNEYLAALSPESRKGLQKLRKIIAAAAPKAEQGFSYGIPAFRLDGRPLVWFAAFKAHCSFFPGAGAIRLHAADLRHYKTSKGTIQFSPDSPPPAKLISKLIKARIEEMNKRRG
jgi:uncharacterized protein YdhG (YjbR/CyaY superfamily)